jgi:hypothetical protein
MEFGGLGVGLGGRVLDGAGAVRLGLTRLGAVGPGAVGSGRVRVGVPRPGAPRPGVAPTGSDHHLPAGRGLAGVGVGNGAGYAHGIAMKLSTLLICLGGLLSATGLGGSQMWSRRSIKQVYLEVKAGRGRVGLYAMIVAPVSLVLIIAGLYLAFTWR